MKLIQYCKKCNKESNETNGLLISWNSMAGGKDSSFVCYECLGKFVSDGLLFKAIDLQIFKNFIGRND